MIAEGRLWDDVDARAAHAPWKEGRWRVLDVRTPQEMARGILAGALCIPVDELEARVKELPRDGTPLLVYCASGGRSAAACEFLSHAGFDELHNLEGGISAWPHGTVKPG
ncbi:MAG: rhodanese-like domain-containing protein [Planctomycetes bacterium]|nr:rhodanese-like domain-containing protein [Planctomycetota bacterium]